ncbi:MAG TPA: class I SAM-dependent methyltransferase [Usitatibacteraceae bacterium]|nr:class I SAM-dependent methyltransferase [Usitatibacteraceae bacterium]
MPKSNATTRFSDRVADYVKYRPSYPVEILDLLADRCGLTPESVIADIGSGTGILTKMFLDNGNPVVGVEPNADMREAAEAYLSEYARFTSLAGSAEATRLPRQAIDFIVAGQAFHWFDRGKTRDEFLRIGKEGAWVALIWNDRRLDSTPFLRDYEAFLHEHGTDYAEINHKNVQDPAVINAFFGSAPAEASFDNVQRFDFDGLMGRIASSSYMPGRGDARFPAMQQAARALFDRHQSQGRVAFEYDTRVYYGQPA